MPAEIMSQLRPDEIKCYRAEGFAVPELRLSPALVGYAEDE